MRGLLSIVEIKQQAQSGLANYCGRFFKFENQVTDDGKKLFLLCVSDLGPCDPTRSDAPFHKDLVGGGVSQTLAKDVGHTSFAVSPHGPRGHQMPRSASGHRIL